MLEKLRNIGIIAHVDAGKTTLTERILYFGGSKHKAGDVDEGNTTTDYDPLEAEQGITIQSAAVSVAWDGTHISLIDLVRMKFWAQDPADATHLRYEWQEIPAAYRDEAAMWHEHLLEAASHGCDTLLEYVVEGKPVSEEMLRKALRQGTLSGKIVPIHCGSAKEFHGVRLLLDAVTDYLPSPLERPPVKGVVPKTKEKQERKPDPAEPLAALAFKTISEQHGDLVFLRIYSGTMESATTVQNVTTGRPERASHIYRLMG